MKDWWDELLIRLWTSNPGSGLLILMKWCLTCWHNSRGIVFLKCHGNEWSLEPRSCTCKAILGRGQPGLMRWIFLWCMPLAQDRSFDLFTSNPARYHCTTDISHENVFVLFTSTCCCRSNSPTTEMQWNGVLFQDYCKAILGRGQPAVNILYDHALGARSLARNVDRQSGALPLCYDCPLAAVDSSWNILRALYARETFS